MEEEKSEDSEYEEGAIPSSSYDNLTDDKDSQDNDDNDLNHFIQTKTIEGEPTRTCFVISSHSSLLSPVLDIASTPDSSGNVNSAHMTGIGQIVESITQYTRILFDIFPSRQNSSASSDRYSVSILSAGEDLMKLNNFTTQQQNLKMIMDGFGKVRVGKSKSLAAAKTPEAVVTLEKEIKILETAVRQAATSLFAENSSSSSYSPSSSRLILFVPSPSPFYASNEIEEETLFEGSLRNTIRKKEELRKGFLRKEILEIESSILPDALTDLCMFHFNLRALRITGIPMKESAPSSSPSSAASRAIYDVILLSPSSPHVFPDSDNLVSIFPLGSGKIKKNREEVLHWKGTDKKFNASLFPSRCIHRVSPLLLFSSPSSCLMKHVCSAKPVSLISSSVTNMTSSASFPSHLLLLHDNDVWLHCLYPSPCLDQYLGASFYSSNISGYRTKDFSNLVSSALITSNTKQVLPLCNMKFQAPLSSSSTSYTTNSALEKATRLFPYQEKDTVLLAANQGEDTKKFLEPLKLFLIHYETLDEQSLDAAIDYIGRLHLISTSTEAAKIFPNQQADSYWKLCTELVALAKRSPPSSSSSSSHIAYKKILDSLQKLWPELYSSTKSSTSFASPVPQFDSMSLEAEENNNNNNNNNQQSKKRTANENSSSFPFSDTNEQKSFHQLYWQSKEKTTKRMKIKEFDGRLPVPLPLPSSSSSVSS